MYYIDLGSSTIKVYRYDNTLELLEEHSIYFKNGFSEKDGISCENLEELCSYFSMLKEKYQLRYENTFIYVTGIFRSLSLPLKQEMLRLFNDKFDLHFNIISHGIENYYLACAMKHDYNGKKILIINMGGKTTELVTFQGGIITSTHNLNVGVADLLNQFTKVNEHISGDKIEEIESFVLEKLGDLTLDQDYDAAIFTGGEERFELLTGFHLVENTLFQDGIHRYMVSFDDYVLGTEKVFYSMTMDQLYELMPGNPKWMDGARSGAVLPLALFRLTGIKWIVPSDLNLIHGVIRDLN